MICLCFIDPTGNHSVDFAVLKNQAMKYLVKSYTHLNHSKLFTVCDLSVTSCSFLTSFIIQSQNIDELVTK